MASTARAERRASQTPNRVAAGTGLCTAPGTTLTCSPQGHHHRPARCAAHGRQQRRQCTTARARRCRRGGAAVRRGTALRSPGVAVPVPARAASRPCARSTPYRTHPTAPLGACGQAGRQQGTAQQAGDAATAAAASVAAAAQASHAGSGSMRPSTRPSTSNPFFSSVPPGPSAAPSLLPQFIAPSSTVASLFVSSWPRAPLRFLEGRRGR